MAETTTEQRPAGVLPLTYDECRARFGRAAAIAGARLSRYPIEATGPEGQRLTIDAVRLGPDTADRVLVVLSGVHGVEGFIGSALQSDLLTRLDPATLPPGVGVLAIHAVNPWGMAWWRRQNESNVDLNRNWARDRIDPPANPGYAELHHLLCPVDGPPSSDSFLGPVARYVQDHGLDWVRRAVSAGQYSHPDGLYFGGDRLEASTRIVGDLVADELAGTAFGVCVDLHTGHGPTGEPTILSDHRIGSPGDLWLRRHFDPAIVEATVDNPDATSATKVGQISHGLAEVLPGAEWHSFTLEIGTRHETRMLLAEREEHWVHLHGDRSDPGHAQLVWNHRVCSTPDDPAWVAAAMGHGRTVLAAALRSFTDGPAVHDP